MSRHQARRPRSATLHAREELMSWPKPSFVGRSAPLSTRGLASRRHDDGWLEALTLARTRQDVDDASYAVLSRMHDLLVARDERRCDAILRAAPVDRLPIQVLLALLASTLKARASLGERARFFERVEERLRRDEPTRADRLLKGLR